MEFRRDRFARRVIGGTVVAAMLAVHSVAEPLPSQLRGSWRITHILTTTNVGCWSAERAKPLVGSILTYEEKKMHWQGGEVPLLGITSRTVTEEDLRKDDVGNPHPLSFAQLEIKSPVVTEVDLQHEDQDITGASTEVPGDSILLAGANRIIVSACGVYFEATRLSTPHGKSHR
jgi:hypothetical protein